MNTLLERYARLVARRPGRILVAILLVTAGLGYAARTVGLDNNFAQLFATSSEATEFRERYRNEFGADDGVLIAILRSPRPFDPKLPAAVETISRAMRDDEAVGRIYSAVDTSVPWSTDDGVVVAPAFGESSPFDGDVEERVRLLDEAGFGGSRLVSKDGTLFVVAAELYPELDSYELLVDPSKRFERAVEAATQGTDLEHFYAGVPFTRIAATESMEGDLFKLAPLNMAVLALVMFFFFRRWLGVAIAMTCIGITVVMTAGVFGIFGDDLNQVTIIYPILLMVVVVANAAHALHRYQDERAHGLSEANALHVVATQVTRASLLTSVTTAAGFASLMIARMEVLHRFGFYLAIGVMLAFVVVVAVVPACLAMLGARLIRPIAVPASDPFLEAPRLARFVTRITRRRTAAWITAAGFSLFAGLLWVGTFVQYDFRLSESIYPSHPIAIGNRIADEHLGGALPVEISFLGAEGDFGEPANLRRMNELETWMMSELPVQPPASIASVVREIHESFTGSATIPDVPEAIPQLLLVAESSPDRIIPQLVNEDRSHARMRSVTPDFGARYVVDMQRRIEKKARALFAGTGIRVRMTGEAPVAYEGTNRLSEELIHSVGVALLFAVFVIGIAFRSARVAIASILPNMLPIAIALAFYGFTGQAVDPLPGIAFCIGLGMAVDDTVHVLARYREELRAGHGSQSALVRAVVSLRGALVSSSVILACGFAVLTLSDFSMNRTLGALGSALIVLALGCDVLFTPAVLTLLPLKTPAREKFAVRESDAEPLPST